MRKVSWVVAVAVLGALAVACNTGDLDSQRSAVECLPSDDNAMVFDQAVCLCGDLDKVGSGLTTSSFSSFGRGKDTEGKAHVGINGSAVSIGRLAVDGALAVGGPMAVTANVTVKRDLMVGADLMFQGHTSVEGDALVAGDVSGNGHLDVLGALAVGGSVNAQGNLACSDVTEGAVFELQQPCNCGPERMIDVPAEVAAHAGDARVDLSAAGSDPLVLAAGDYYAEGPAFLRGASRLRIEGAVRLFVAGDIDIQGGGVIDLAEGAELDLYVAGSISKVGKLVAGAKHNDPASRTLRLYLGGGTPVALDVTGNTVFEGNIYAPQADIRYTGNVRIRGSVYARNLVGNGHFVVEYDSGIVGGGCEGDGGDDDGDGDDGDNGGDSGADDTDWQGDPEGDGSGDNPDIDGQDDGDPNIDGEGPSGDLPSGDDGTADDGDGTPGGDDGTTSGDGSDDGSDDGTTGGDDGSTTPDNGGADDTGH